jgi:hypothetical protein
MRFMILFLIVLFSLCVEGRAAGLSGTVKSASGKPVTQVLIIYGRSLNEITETDARGAFSLPHFGQVISFRRAGFRPLTKIVDSTMTTLNVTLEDAVATEWLIPSCAVVKGGWKRVGYSLRVPVPKGAVLRKGRDIDYTSFSIGYGPAESRVWLSGIEGPMASLGVPPEDWILKATEFSERSYRSGETVGFDMRGRLADGTYWRYVGRLGESVNYGGVSQEAAAFFDKILDSICRGK